MRKSTLVALLVAGSLLIPAAVYASHQFTDVPNSHTFHNAIDWMKDNGITVGCNPPANTQYCPQDNVSRGQMAAFMKRLAENNVVDAATLDGLDSTDFLGVGAKAADADKLDGQDSAAYTNPAAGVLSDNVSAAFGVVAEAAELSITAPAAGGLVVNGVLTPNSNATGQATFWLQADNATCTFDSANFYSIDFGRVQQTGLAGTGSSVVGVVAVGAGAHTITFCVRTFDGGPMGFDASLVAQYVTSVTKTGSLSSTAGGGAGEPTS